MCVIAFSPKGVDIPTEEQMRAMWDVNPDGAGFAYVDNRGQVIYRKGFMTLAELLAELTDREKYKRTNFAIHFRIGTSGENDGATCHPFPVSDKFGDLRKTEGRGTPVLFHNGILDTGGVCDPLASDTQDFTIALYPMLKKYNHSKTRDHFIEKLIEGNRVLVLYNDNRYKMFGRWEKDGDLYVSNTNYKYYTYSYHNYYNYDYNWMGEAIDEGQATLASSKIDEADEADEADACDLHLPEYPTQNLEPQMTDEAMRLWEKVIRNEYAFYTPRELAVLRDSSDWYSKDYFYYDGYKLGIDEKQSMVWLEDTPPMVEQEPTVPTEMEQVELALAGEEVR